ncbi:MAG: EamA family transporter [Pseudomonas sp.]
MPTSANRTRSLLLIGAFLVIYIGWGTTYLANHFLLRELPPFIIGTLRFLFAGLLALLWAVSRGEAHVQAGNWGSALIGGLLLIAIGQGALIYANLHLPTGMLAMLYTTLPLWSVALEWLLGERPPLWVLLGLALASGGIVLLMSNGLGSDAGPLQWFSGALVLLATLLWAVGAWWMRQRAPFRSSWFGLSLQMLIGAAVLAVIGLWHGDWQALHLANLSGHGWLWLAYLVLPVSLGVYPAYFWLLREVRPSLVSTFAFVNPVVALLLGFLILGEQLSLSAGLACLATLGGVSLIIFGRR